MSMSNERKNPEYFHRPVTPPDDRRSHLRLNILFYLAVALMVVFFATLIAKGDDSPKSESTPPVTPQVVKASPSSLLAIREQQVKLSELLQRMEQLKQLYQQYQIQVQEAEKAMNAARDKAYAEAGVTPDKYDLDLDTHEFKPKKVTK